MTNLPAVINVPVEQSDLNETKLKLEKKCKKTCDRSANIQQNANNKDNFVKSCDTTDTSWILDEEKKLIDHLKESVSGLKLDYPSTDPEKYMELYETLRNQNAQQCAVLEHSRKDLEEERIVNDELLRSLNIIESNMEKLKSSETQHLEVLDMKSLKEESSMKFNEMKNYLHLVLDKLYSKGNMKSLVQKLTNTYFKIGDDKYIEIRDTEEFVNVELLKQAHLVVSDPYNERRIKFANFM